MWHQPVLLTTCELLDSSCDSTPVADVRTCERQGVGKEHALTNC